MNELPRLEELDDAYHEHAGRTARRVGIEALEHELHGEVTDKVEIALYVKGRMIHTNTDSATVQRIMAILTGLGG